LISQKRKKEEKGFGNYFKLVTARIIFLKIAMLPICGVGIGSASRNYYCELGTLKKRKVCTIGFLTKLARFA